MKLLTMLFALLIANVSYAEQTLSMPEGEVILEVRGAISHTNVDDEAHFDRAMLEALPSGTITTANHVVSPSVEYKGPILSALLEAVGAQGKTVRVIALDDYSSELSYDDIKKYGVLLATHEGGRQMTLDDRGPLFVVFPFDEHKELRQDLYYSKSVWQVMSIEVE
jgi:hypothetical protein